MNIVLLEDLAVPEEVLDSYRKKLEEQGHTLQVYERTGDLKTLQEEIRPADALILANMPLPWKALEGADHLKYIDVAFTGTDHIPVREATANGIQVSNASGYATESVAELALCFALELLRKLPSLHEAGKAGGTKQGLRGRLLKDRTVGIVGAGHIGKRTAELFHALGANVLAYNRSAVSDPAIAEQVPLKELLQRSNVVSLHLPLTESTRGLIGKEELQSMKPDAFLINTARGPVVDSQALAQALEQGTIAGAALDVFDTEPPLPSDDPLLHAPNTILTPHMGFDSEESMLARAEIVFDNLQNWLDGHPVNLVNAE